MRAWSGMTKASFASVFPTPACSHSHPASLACRAASAMSSAPIPGRRQLPATTVPRMNA